MRKCSKCEQEYSDEFAFCPHCGEAYAEKAVEQEKSAENDTKQEESGFAVKVKKFGIKLANFEQKNRIIKKVLPLFFSLILFICSFFSGASYTFLVDSSGYSLKVPHDVFQMTGSAFAVFNSNPDSMQKYINENANEISYALSDGYDYMMLKYGSAYRKALNSATVNSDKVDTYLSYAGQYMANHYSVNLVTFRLYQAKLYPQGHPTDSTPLAAVVQGVYMSWVAIAMHYAVMISSFVYLILSIVALVKRKEIRKPFNAAMLPFSFLLVKIVALVINPIYLLDPVTVVMIVFASVFALLTCAYKFAFESDLSKQGLMVALKNLTLVVLSAIAFFVATGPLLIFKDSTSIVSYRGGDISFGYRIFTDHTLYPVIIVAFVVFLMYMAMMISAATMVGSVWNRMYGRGGSKMLGRTISSLVFTILSAGILILWRALSDELGSEPIISANLIVAFIMFIAIIVVNGAWKVDGKKRKSLK